MRKIGKFSFILFGMLGLAAVDGGNFVSTKALAANEDAFLSAIEVKNDEENLNGNYTFGNDCTITYSGFVDSNADAEIDLNGHKLIVTDTYPLKIYGKVLFKNGTILAKWDKDDIIGRSGECILISSTSNVSFEDITFESENIANVKRRNTEIISTFRDDNGTYGYSDYEYFSMTNCTYSGKHSIFNFETYGSADVHIDHCNFSSSSGHTLLIGGDVRKITEHKANQTVDSNGRYVKSYFSNCVIEQTGTYYENIDDNYKIHSDSMGYADSAVDFITMQGGEHYFYNVTFKNTLNVFTFQHAAYAPRIYLTGNTKFENCTNEFCFAEYRDARAPSFTLYDNTQMVVMLEDERNNKTDLHSILYSSKEYPDADIGAIYAKKETIDRISFPETSFHFRDIDEDPNDPTCAYLVYRPRRLIKVEGLEAKLTTLEHGTFQWCTVSTEVKDVTPELECIDLNHGKFGRGSGVTRGYADIPGTQATYDAATKTWTPGEVYSEEDIYEPGLDDEMVYSRTIKNGFTFPFFKFTGKKYESLEFDYVIPSDCGFARYFLTNNARQADRIVITNDSGEEIYNNVTMLSPFAATPGTYHCKYTLAGDDVLTPCFTVYSSDSTALEIPIAIKNVKVTQFAYTPIEGETTTRLQSPVKDNYVFTVTFNNYMGDDPSLKEKFDVFYCSPVVDLTTTDFVKVNFDDTSVKAETIIKGDKAYRPADPVKSGYTFVGFFKDSSYSEPFDFNVAINEDITIYVKFTESSGGSGEGSGEGSGGGQGETGGNKYSVSFSGTNIPTLTVDSGGKAVKPADPKQDGKKFAGWYIDPECTQPFDFNQPITANTCLYAKWVDAPATCMNHIMLIIMFVLYLAFVIVYNYVLKLGEKFYDINKISNPFSVRDLRNFRRHDLISIGATFLEFVLLTVFGILSNCGVCVVFIILNVFALAFGVCSFLIKDKIVKIISRFKTKKVSE